MMVWGSPRPFTSKVISRQWYVARGAAAFWSTLISCIVFCQYGCSREFGEKASPHNDCGKWVGNGQVVEFIGATTDVSIADRLRRCPLDHSSTAWSHSQGYCDGPTLRQWGGVDGSRRSGARIEMRNSLSCS